MAKRKKGVANWLLPLDKVLGIVVGGFVVISASSQIKDSVEEINQAQDAVEAVEVETLINNEIFEEVYTDYDEYVDLIGKAIEESDMNNSSMEAFVAYTNMEKNGWISWGKEFNYGVPEIEPIGNMGISIPTGTGVCRNEAFNMYRVFNSLGYECGVVGGNLYRHRPTEENGHALVYVVDGKHLYLYDPTNNTIFLKDVLGRYICIDDEELKFYPTLCINGKMNLVFFNEIFASIKEDYGSRITYDTRRDRAQDKIDELGNYYALYEIMYLLPYEKRIVDDLDTYSDIVDQILNDRGEEAVELKFN